MALSTPPQHEQAWARGAAGEVKVANVLARRAGAHGVALLHDRCIPASRANIDHIAIGPSGVFVIDAKRYSGWIAVEHRGGLLRPRTSHLVVGGRDKTKLVDGVLRQGELVRTVLVDAGHDEVRIRPVLCFVAGDWPLIGGLEVKGVPILSPRKTAKLCRAEGQLTSAAVEKLADELARRFPAA